MRRAAVTPRPTPRHTPRSTHRPTPPPSPYSPPSRQKASEGCQHSSACATPWHILSRGSSRSTSYTTVLVVLTKIKVIKEPVKIALVNKCTNIPSQKSFCYHKDHTGKVKTRPGMRAKEDTVFAADRPTTIRAMLVNV